MKNPVSVLIVDDEPDIRLLLRGVLHSDQGFDVIGEASSGAEALSETARLDPDVVILDYRMPDLTGIDVARELLAKNPGQQIVLFSAFLTDDTVADALAIGVKACLSKDRVLDLADRLERL